MGRPRKELSGKEFGRLTVKSYSHTDSHGHIHWNCICSCGEPCTATTDHLIRGLTRSCGCFRRDRKLSIPKQELTQACKKIQVAVQSLQAFFLPLQTATKDATKEFEAFSALCQKINDELAIIRKKLDD